jgi:hypothetical protein
MFSSGVTFSSSLAASHLALDIATDKKHFFKLGSEIK